jgi:hypothetical protein
MLHRGLCKHMVAPIIAAALLSAGCGTPLLITGKISETGIRFDQGNAQGPKTIFATVQHPLFEVSEAEVEVEVATWAVTLPPTIFKKEFLDVEAEFEGAITTYSYTNALFAAIREIDDEVTATWRFLLTSSDLPDSELSATYTYRYQFNNLAVVEGATAFLAAGGIVQPQGGPTGPQVTLFAGPPIDVFVSVQNLGPTFQDPVSVRIREVFPGGSAVPGGFDRVGTLAGGFEAGATRQYWFKDVRFTSTPETVFRTIHTEVNQPPNPVVMEANFSDNVMFDPFIVLKETGS